MNRLGLNIGSQPDGLTVGYFTTSATQSLVDDPVLKVKLYDFVVVAAARGWNMVYARKDIVPGGLTAPSRHREGARRFSSAATPRAPRMTRGCAWCWRSWACPTRW